MKVNQAHIQTDPLLVAHTRLNDNLGVRCIAPTYGPLLICRWVPWHTGSFRHVG